MRNFAGTLATLSFLIPAATAAENATVEHMEAAGAQIPYVEAGEGEPVLLVHGAWSDLRIWETVLDAVAEDFRFIAYTQRGFGTADWPEEPPLSRDAHAADLVALLEAWGEPMHLVGWSYSGPIVLEAALNRPDLVRSIVIFEPTLDTVLEGKPEHEQTLADWNSAWGPVLEAAERGGDEEAVRLAIEYVFGLPEGGFETMPEGFRSILLGNAHTVPALFAAPPPRRLACEDLGGVETPVLILWGETTLPFFEAAAKEVAACLPNAKLEEMPDVGHGAPVQASEAFLDRTLSFLRGDS